MISSVQERLHAKGLGVDGARDVDAPQELQRRPRTTAVRGREEGDDELGKKGGSFFQPALRQRIRRCG